MRKSLVWMKGIVPGITPHSFRHGVGTNLVGAAVSPKVVAELLGHSDVATTLRTYTKVRPDATRKATGMLSEAYGA